MKVADLAAILATVLAVWTLLPQVRKLRRTRDASGVSSVWAAIGATLNVGWSAYLISQELWWALPSTWPMIFFYAAVVILVIRHGPADPRPPILAAAVSGLALATITVGAGWSALGSVLSIGAVAQMTPSVWTAYRTYLPRGIAPATWGIACIEAILWGIYGLAYADLPIIVFAGAQSAAAVLMLLRYRATRHRWAAGSAEDQRSTSIIGARATRSSSSD